MSKFTTLPNNSTAHNDLEDVFLAHNYRVTSMCLNYTTTNVLGRSHVAKERYFTLKGKSKDKFDVI
jgi:hypothetical protein